MLLGNSAIHMCELYEGRSGMPLHHAAAAEQAKAFVGVEHSSRSYILAGIRIEGAALPWSTRGCLHLWAALHGLR